jgi:phosphoribosylaminoimidazole-succinocarboxamide synthase
MADVILKTEIDGAVPRRGKVRDIYDLGDKLLIVATDRLSAFDVIMANGIPYKGIVLTQISKFWLEFLEGDVAAVLQVRRAVSRSKYAGEKG